MAKRFGFINQKRIQQNLGVSAMRMNVSKNRFAMENSSNNLPMPPQHGNLTIPRPLNVPNLRRSVPTQVQQLLTTESTIATTDPTRQKLLTALRLVNRKEDAVSTATVLRMLTEIARDARSVQRAFPMNSSQRDATWVFLIDAIAEHLQFFLDAPNPLPSARVESQLRALAGDLIPHLEPIKAAIRRVGWSYRYWALAAWVTIGTALGVAFALVVSLSAQSLFGNLRELWAVGGNVRLCRHIHRQLLLLDLPEVFTRPGASQTTNFSHKHVHKSLAIEVVSLRRFGWRDDRRSTCANRRDGSIDPTKRSGRQCCVFCAARCRAACLFRTPKSAALIRVEC